MAKLAGAAGPALIKAHDYSHIIRWYRETLPNVAPPPPARWEPVKVGPTWDWNAERGWNLPEHSMGWEALGWCGYWLRDVKGQDWQFTPEQARFLLWFESLDDEGRIRHRTAVFQRLKGHGKDPFACALASCHAFGPVIFDYFDGNGDPVGREDNAAWIQVVAVSKTQTQNTMKLFPVMLKPEVRAHYGIQVGRENVHGVNDTRHIQASTSNWLAIEGKRTTLGIRNEPQNWTDTNQGHELAGAMNGNAGKIPENQGRMLDIQNAFREGADSVAQRRREAWERTQATDDRDATHADFNLLMDSLEAPADAPLTIEAIPEVIEAVRGDSVWLDPRTIIEDIVGGTTASEARRKWYNNSTSAGDTWVSAAEFDAWFRDEIVADGTPIFLFGDGSKSDDHTAITGIRISDGLCFPIGIWIPQTFQQAGREHSMPIRRDDVDAAVHAAHAQFNVQGFWFDPSDARDDDTGERYWEPYCDLWANKYGRHYKLPAVPAGSRRHAVIWDMRNPMILKEFTAGAERALTDIVGERDGEQKIIGPSPTPLLHNCPQPDGGEKGRGQGVLMRQQVANMRRRGNKFGWAVGKEHRESRRKIDAGVCMIGSRIMWHKHLAAVQKGRAPDDGSITTFGWNN